MAGIMGEGETRPDAFGIKGKKEGQTGQGIYLISASHLR